MLEYDRTDISEGIDINKCEETSREIYISTIIDNYFFGGISDMNNSIFYHMKSHRSHS